MWGKKPLGRIGVLLLILILPLSVGVTDAAPPYDRIVTWTNATTYTDGSPIAASDNLVAHVYVCLSSTDNTTCTEVGQSANNASVWSGTTTVQPVDSTRHWRLRSESRLHGSMSAFSGAYSFFLSGTAPPGAPSAPNSVQ